MKPNSLPAVSYTHLKIHLNGKVVRSSMLGSVTRYQIDCGAIPVNLELLNHDTVSYTHLVAAVRETLGLAPIAPFARWLERWGFWQDGRLGPNAGDASVLL